MTAASSTRSQPGGDDRVILLVAHTGRPAALRISKVLVGRLAAAGIVVDRLDAAGRRMDVDLHELIAENLVLGQRFARLGFFLRCTPRSDPSKAHARHIDNRLFDTCRILHCGDGRFDRG